MAAHRSSFDKLQRDRDKKARAAAKRERRLEKVEDGVAVDTVPTGTGTLESAAELLTLIESIHQRREAGTLSQEDFEEQKADLLARLPID